MTALAERLRVVAFTLTTLLLIPAGTLALEPAEYLATYDVYIDGKRRIETVVRLEQENAHWTLENRSTGIKGLPRLLKLKSNERAVVHWAAGTIRPLEFSQHTRVAGRDDDWQARFDWDTGIAVTLHDEGESRLQLPTGAVDRLSLTHALRERLESGQSQWAINVLDEDQIDEHRYRSTAAQATQTALGCLQVHRVERIRENSERYSDGWYAREFDFIPVRIRHGKRGGKDFDMHIRSLRLAGTDVEKKPDCN